MPSERPDEQVCSAHTATTSLIALLRLLWTGLMPDTQRLQVSCLLSECALSSRDAEVRCKTGEGSPQHYLAPTVLVSSQNSLADRQSLLYFVTGKIVAFELCDQQSSVQTVRSGHVCMCMRACVLACACRAHMCVRACMCSHVCVLCACLCSRARCHVGDPPYELKRRKGATP